MPNEILTDQDVFCHLVPYCCLEDHVPGQTIHLAVICVFCVHHLPASALEFLLCNAADKRLRTYCRTGDSADTRSIASDGIVPIAIGQRFHATITIPQRNGLPIRPYWREGWISLWPPGLRRCVSLATTDQNHCAEVLGVAGEPDDPPARGQAFGGKNTRARTSMLSLGGASAGASGFSNEVWNDSLARPSLALSWTRIRIASSGCCSEK